METPSDGVLLQKIQTSNPRPECNPALRAHFGTSCWQPKGLLSPLDPPRALDAHSIALHLARDGFDIALNDISSKHDQLHAVTDDAETASQKSLAVPGDVTSKGMVREVAKGLGGLGASTSSALELVTLLDGW